MGAGSGVGVTHMHKGIPHLHSGTPTMDSPEVALATKSVFSCSVNLEIESAPTSEEFAKACVSSF